MDRAREGDDHVTSVYGRMRLGAGRLRARLGRRQHALRDKLEVTTPLRFARSGRVPVVQLETTHLGPEVDEAVFNAKRRMRLGTDADYDLLYAHFDVLHYLLQAPELLDQPDVDLIEHFLERGVEERLSPDPDFSMSEYIARYRRKCLESDERSPFLIWLRRGRAGGDIADPAPGVMRMAYVLGMHPQHLVNLISERRRDLQQRFRTGTLGEMLVKASEIEPLIGAVWTEVARPKLLPISTPVVVGEVTAIHQAQEAAGFRRARLVFVINRARWGGGRRMEGHIAHALADHMDPSEIVVIYTDDSTESPAGRFPEGVREIDFASMVAHVPKERAQHALAMLLRSFHADAIININSRMLYHGMRDYGRALAATERLFLCFFCNEQTAMGTWEGWSLRYFYRTFDYVAGVITDSDYLAREITDTYRVGERQLERMHVFRAPVDPQLPVITESPASPERSPQVFWAGRWDRQKRIPLFLSVAELLPDVEFRMWGESVMGKQTRKLPQNVTLEGRYDHIAEIPLHEADVWLYTSGWDGVPSQLLEVAMTGIPIVGSLVGGTGEVLSEEDAWPVAEDDSAAAYAAAIRSALADPVGSRRRAVALRERMLRERTEKEFADQVVDVLLDPEESDR
jgi:glycosyltransferase involved in cell wall biosynthesis